MHVLFGLGGTLHMKSKISLLLALGCFAGASAFAAGPCKDKRETKHKAHMDLHACLQAWAKDAKPDAADPSDDCSAKLASFVQAAKDFKACRVQAKSQKKK
jgi:hypothetical protein